MGHIPMIISKRCRQLQPGGRAAPGVNPGDGRPPPA